MKQITKFLAVLGLVSAALLACTKPEPTPEPDPTPAEAPVANFTVAINALEVTFTNTSENATSYKWEFGDGETSTEASPKHAYAQAGEYTVKLTAANANGATSKKEEKLVLVGKAKAYFSVSEVEGREGKFGKILAFDATASENAASIVWDFGDNTTGTDFQCLHEFPDYGRYTVKATITGEGGDTDVYTEEVEAIAKNELLKGGNCEEDDAQYWTLVISEIGSAWADGGEAIPGTQAWKPVWGYTEDGPSAKVGGCLQFTNQNIRDQAANILMYQPIDVKAGDVLRVSCDMKWGDRTNNSGLCWFGFATEPGALLDGGLDLWDIFNYWGAFEDAGVPAFDGGFAGTPEYIANREALGFSGDGSQNYAEYVVPADGTIYFTMEYRSVWGGIYGEDVKIYFDNISCKIIL